MEKRRNLSFKPIEPELDGQPELCEVGEDTPPSVCVALREARLRAGLEIDDVSRSLLIQREHLEALEEGRFDDLPGNTYAVGFLRSYSEFLGLDRDLMVERFKDEAARGGVDAPLSFPVPNKEGRAPKPWLILVVVALAGLAYGGWHYYSSQTDDDSDLVSDLSSKLTQAAGIDAADDAASEGAGQTTAEAVATTGETVTAAADAAETADTMAASESTGATDSVVESAAETETETQTASVSSTAEDAVSATLRDDTETAAPVQSDSLWDNSARRSDAAASSAADAASDASGVVTRDVASVDTAASDDALVQASATSYVPQVFGRNNEDARIVITAKADSWVQVQGPQNELLLTRILRAGDSYRVPDREGLVMVTGNAGALQISVDGEVVDAIGPIGVVRRDVVLDADALKAGIVAE